MLCLTYLSRDNFSMTSKCSGWCKFTETMTNHSFNNQHGNKMLTIMNHQRVSDKIRRNLTRTRPSFNWLMLATFFLLHDFLKQFFVCIWSFFTTSTHIYLEGLCFPGFLLDTIYLFEYFFGFRVFPTALRPA